MKTKFILITCLLGLSSLNAINGQYIKGKVCSPNGLPVANATIIMQTVDSIYVHSACTDSLGLFHLPSDLTDYRLIIHHLLYETHEELCCGRQERLIYLKEKDHSLQEVIVKGARSLFQLTDGKIVYDMPLLLKNKVVGNVYEALLQLPGVREQDGALVLAGATGVSILINGQTASMPLSNLIALLKMLPQSQLESAEIMYGSSPEYHVRGASINLIMKEQARERTLEGQLNSTYFQKHDASYTAGAALLYTATPWSTHFNYSYDINHEKTGVHLYAHHPYHDQPKIIEQFNRGSRRANTHYLRMGVNYTLPHKTKLALTYTSQIKTAIRHREYSEGTFAHSINHKTNQTPVQLHNILLSYTSDGGKAGVEYTHYHDYTSQNYREYRSSKNRAFITRLSQRINQLRIFGDRSHPVGSWTLNYGAQYAYAHDRSFQCYNHIEKSDAPSSNFDSHLTEHTAQAYIGIKKTIGDKFSLSASLTGEYYEFAEVKVWSAFPTLAATYTPSSSYLFHLSFSSDKTYPEYWQLHGGKSYLNGYAEVHGNRFLKPYREFSGQLSTILNRRYTLTLYGNYLKDYSAQLPYQEPNHPLLIYQVVNFDYKRTFGLNIILPFRMGRIWDARLTVNTFYDKVKNLHFHDLSFEKEKCVLYSRLDNTIRLSAKPDIKLEIAGAYISKSIQGPLDLSALWNVDAGIQWSFWNNRAELRLKGTDLFNRWTPDIVMRYASQNLRMDIIPDSRTVTLSFTLRLGDFKSSEKRIDSSRFGTH